MLKQITVFLLSLMALQAQAASEQKEQPAPKSQLKSVYYRVAGGMIMGDHAFIHLRRERGGKKLLTVLGNPRDEKLTFVIPDSVFRQCDSLIHATKVYQAKGFYKSEFRILDAPETDFTVRYTDDEENFSASGEIPSDIRDGKNAVIDYLQSIYDKRQGRGNLVVIDKVEETRKFAETTWSNGRINYTYDTNGVEELYQFLCKDRGIDYDKDEWKCWRTEGSGQSSLVVYNPEQSVMEVFLNTMAGEGSTQTGEPVPGKWPQTSQRLLTRADLEQFSTDELELMVNELSARHGCRMTKASMQQYFDAQPWYHNRGWRYMPLTDVERQNEQLILMEREWRMKKAAKDKADGHQRKRLFVESDTLMVHDPAMALEDGKYYLLSTGHGLNWATSIYRKGRWNVQPTPVIKEIPQWTYDSVPGFKGHVWAPDVIWKDGNWWLAYSCSTFGRNTSAIGLMAAERMGGPWRDLGPLVCSKEKRDHWNAIDPAFVIDKENKLWLAWGSFWDGIQIARLNETMDLDTKPMTIARRVALADTLKMETNPTSKHAGRNAIEAPFILRHGDYFYLFVSWDYCCRGEKSSYRVAVGRSKNVAGPYLDRKGRDMAEGGGTVILEGDKKEYEAAGHCAAYDFGYGDMFICHGYYLPMKGASILVRRMIEWTKDGWPEL